MMHFSVSIMQMLAQAYRGIMHAVCGLTAVYIVQCYGFNSVYNQVVHIKINRKGEDYNIISLYIQVPFTKFRRVKINTQSHVKLPQIQSTKCVLMVV